VIRLVVLLVSALVTSSVLVTSHACESPYEDPLLAAVPGTPEQRAEMGCDIPRREREIVVCPDREISRIVPRKTPRYATTMQDGPAPLICLIAGTGGSHRGGRMKMLAARVEPEMLDGALGERVAVCIDFSFRHEDAANDWGDVEDRLQPYAKRFRQHLDPAHGREPTRPAGGVSPLPVI
jgi:hypothetical protein